MDLRAEAKKHDFEALVKRNFTRKITSAKIEKSADKSLWQPLVQPLQFFLQDPAAKDNSITLAAVAPSNLDAATTMRSADSADTELQSNGVGNCSSKTGWDLDAKAKKRPFWSTCQKE